MKKGKEYTAKKFGWDVIARKTAKGWIVDVQSHVGWQRYFLADEDAGKSTEPLADDQVRRLGVWAQESGKRLCIPANRGTATVVKDAFGNDMRVKV